MTNKLWPLYKLLAVLIITLMPLYAIIVPDLGELQLTSSLCDRSATWEHSLSVQNELIEKA